MSIKSGWLVIDTTDPTKTHRFWRILLSNIPGLVDTSNERINIGCTHIWIEDLLKFAKKPDYIIRLGTYIPKINTDIPTISLIQDIRRNTPEEYFDLIHQIEVINTSKVVVYNTLYTYSKYKKYIMNSNVQQIIIPLGIDFSFFKKIEERHPDVLPNSIIFIGTTSEYPKGFHILLKIIKEMKHMNFCVVLNHEKDITIFDEEDRHRIRLFCKVDAHMIRLLANSCVCCVCTSLEETQHLSGIECAACDIPIVARSVGVYYDLTIFTKSEWGLIADNDDFPAQIDYVVNNRHLFSPRECLKMHYDLETCMLAWNNLVNLI
jgi:glycosyltransferase involved in cell wall biosynthesis